jgi:hypothetical protein
MGFVYEVLGLSRKKFYYGKRDKNICVEKLNIVGLLMYRPDCTYDEISYWCLCQNCVYMAVIFVENKNKFFILEKLNIYVLINV